MEGEEKAREEKEKKKREEAAAKRMIRDRMGEEWVGGRVRTRRRQKRKRSERKRGQCDKYCYRVKVGSTDTFSKHLNLEDVQVLTHEIGIPVAEALGLSFVCTFYRCLPFCSSRL
jgi:hypothetical protein